MPLLEAQQSQALLELTRKELRWSLQLMMVDPPGELARLRKKQRKMLLKISNVVKIHNTRPLGRVLSLLVPDAMIDFFIVAFVRLHSGPDGERLNEFIKTRSKNLIYRRYNENIANYIIGFG